MSNYISQKDLAKVIAQEIIKDNYLSEETLIPKITMILKEFKTYLLDTGYEKLGNPNQYQRQLKAFRILEDENRILYKHIRTLASHDEIKQLWLDRDEAKEKRIEGFEKRLNKRQ